MNQREFEKTEEIEIDFGKILKALLHNALLIVASAAAGTAAAFLLALLITPEYRSSVTFYVKNNSSFAVGGSISSADIAASKELVDSYIVILQSGETLDAVLRFAGSERTCEELQEMISASAVNSTEFFKVTVTSPDPREAERLAGAIGYILPERIAGIMDGASLRIVDGAVMAFSPSEPGYETITIAGFLIGALVSALVIVLQAVLDQTIRNERDIARCCGYPILAVIPEERGAAEESCRLLRTKLDMLLPNGSGVIGVTGAMTGEGQGETAVELARSLRRRGKRVILIDCDLYHSRLAKKLRLKCRPGLSDFLMGKYSLDQVIQQCHKETKALRFPVITAGSKTVSPAELLVSGKMWILLKAFRKLCDYVILILPPAGEAGNMLEIAGRTDGILLAVRRDVSKAEPMRQAVSQLEFIRANILGVVFRCGNHTGNSEP